MPLCILSFVIYPGMFLAHSDVISSSILPSSEALTSIVRGRSVAVSSAGNPPPAETHTFALMKRITRVAATPTAVLLFGTLPRRNYCGRLKPTARTLTTATPRAYSCTVRTNLRESAPLSPVASRARSGQPSSALTGSVVHLCCSSTAGARAAEDAVVREGL